MLICKIVKIHLQGTNNLFFVYFANLSTKQKQSLPQKTAKHQIKTNKAGFSPVPLWIYSYPYS